MSSNLKVNTILPSTGTAIGIGTASGNVDVLGHIVGHNTPNISGINSVTATTFYGSGANLTSLPAQATIANNADNRVITGGSGVNLNGEANLTFDGTNLSIGGNVPEITLTDANSSGTPVCKFSAAGGNINFQADTGSGKADTYIAFSNDGSEKLRINANGDVGIGTDSPQSAGLTVLKHGEARLQVWANGDGSNGKIALRADGTNTQMGTWSNHDCHLVRNASIQATISSTGISLPAGKGIDFSATSDATGMASELFDDYEIGVHTISVTSGGTNPTVNISSNHSKLYYTKIGNMVHVTGELRWTISSHGSGNLRISLPFASDNSQSASSQGTAQTWNVNWAWRSESQQLFSEVQPGATYMRFRIGGSGSLNEDFLQCGSTYQKSANSGYGVEYQVSLWYRTG